MVMIRSSGGISEDARRDRAPVDVPPDDHVELVLDAKPQRGVDVAGPHHIAQRCVPFPAQTLKAAFRRKPSLIFSSGGRREPQR